MDRRQFLAATCAGVLSSPVLGSVTRHASIPGDSPYRFSHNDLERSRVKPLINACYKLQPVKKAYGLYLETAAEEIAAQINQDLAEYQWNATAAQSEPKEFWYKEFRCPPSSRYRYQHIDGHIYDAQAIAIFNRGEKITRFILDRAQWPRDRVIEYRGPLTQEIVAQAAEAIQRDTYGIVTPGDMVLCYNAWEMGALPLDPIKTSWLTGLFCRGTRDAVLLARPGGLVAQAGQGPTFSAITAFFYEELAVWRSDDGREIVCESFVPKLTCPASGIYLKAA